MDNNINIKKNKYKRIFLIAGEPVPAQLDLANFSKSNGFETLMVVLERGKSEIKVDISKINFDIIKINVPFKGVDIKRFLFLPKLYFQLREILKNNLCRDSIVFTTSFDLLFLMYFISLNIKIKLKHQVLDLHKIQLTKSLISVIMKMVEKLLLRGVDSIIVSSIEFYYSYYSKIYNGNVVLLENIPSKKVWSDYKKEKKDGNVFIIAFIGILRYKKSLLQLIKSVHNVKMDTLQFKVLIAGGGVSSDLEAVITNNSLIEFSGSFEYSKDIKRLYRNIDLIYAVYDSYDQNCQVAMPNKFYEAILSKTPIIVAKNTFVEKEVLRLGIGTSVLSGDVNGLSELLKKIDLNKGWYRDAIRNVNKIDIMGYYDNYNNALFKIVEINNINKDDSKIII